MLDIDSFHDRNQTSGYNVSGYGTCGSLILSLDAEIRG
jgi:hypothetical protein